MRLFSDSPQSLAERRKKAHRAPLERRWSWARWVYKHCAALRLKKGKFKP